MSDIWTHLVFLFSNPPTQKVVFKTLSQLKPEDFELSNKFIYSTQSINPKKISIFHGFPLKQFEKLPIAKSAAPPKKTDAVDVPKPASSSEPLINILEVKYERSICNCSFTLYPNPSV